HVLAIPRWMPPHATHPAVSPENLFLTCDGPVNVLDFGGAAAVRQRHKTRKGVVKGKYGYIQPEVVHGQKADRRADVWGLGIVMWELLTAKRLFDFKTDVEMLRAVTDMPIPPPSSVHAGLPPDLDGIVLKALDRNPDKRY